MRFLGTLSDDVDVVICTPELPFTAAQYGVQIEVHGVVSINALFLSPLAFEAHRTKRLKLLSGGVMQITKP